LSRDFVLAGRAIEPGRPVFVIAEAGVNHNGDAAMARALIDAAADSGADAVKFQTFRTSALTSRTAPKAAYQIEATGAGESQSEMLMRLELSTETLRALQAHAAARGIVFFSTPFDEASADTLGALGVPMFKVPSGEITNLPLLRHIAAKGKPIILSTGMSTLDEVAQALAAIGDVADVPVAILHCVSAYPAPVGEVNLRAMDALRDRFGRPVGLSDHTLGLEIALAAVARGAADRREASDARQEPARARPSRLAGAGGDGGAGPRHPQRRGGAGRWRQAADALGARHAARRAQEPRRRARALRAGEELVKDAVAVKRPGTGISPAELERALGRRVRRDLAVDDVIDWTALE
jgi:N-acetylneuraminate synthase/N,N'-diacetyllegionaminate synthase